MGLKAGALLWNRQRIELQANSASFHDTGLHQPNKSFADYSPNEPAINQYAAIGSRIQVIPMSPLPEWTTISHGEPFLDPDGKIMVQFFNSDLYNNHTINVLFWDPHSMVGPGDADTYQAQQ